MKLHSAMIALAAILFLTPNDARAYDMLVGGIYYDKNDDGTTVSVTYKYLDDSCAPEYTVSSPYAGTVTIPSSVTSRGKKYTVTAIGDHAFESCSRLKAVVIPETVTAIGNCAFIGSGITRLKLPSSLRSIGRCAFMSCQRLVSINIPDNLEYIGSYAFASSGLDVASSDGLVYVDGGKALVGTTSDYNEPEIRPAAGTRIIADDIFPYNLDSGQQVVTLPASVTALSANPFACCSARVFYFVNDDNPCFDSRKYDSYNYSNTIIHTATNTLVVGCDNSKIPATVEGIGDKAFANRTFNSIELPAALVRCSDTAFIGCENLVRVTCLAEVPPTLTIDPRQAGESFFSLANATYLYVPAAAVAAYQASPFGKQFAGVRPL
ncbi:MAG: leucine-rich repeat protein [Muribaculaceae bacterium]